MYSPWRRQNLEDPRALRLDEPKGSGFQNHKEDHVFLHPLHRIGAHPSVISKCRGLRAVFVMQADAEALSVADRRGAKYCVFSPVQLGCSTPLYSSPFFFGYARRPHPDASE